MGALFGIWDSVLAAALPAAHDTLVTSQVNDMIGEVGERVPVNPKSAEYAKEWWANGERNTCPCNHR